jgi:hypothetical protein
MQKDKFVTKDLLLNWTGQTSTDVRVTEKTLSLTQSRSSVHLFKEITKS